MQPAAPFPRTQREPTASSKGDQGGIRRKQGRIFYPQKRRRRGFQRIGFKCHSKSSAVLCEEEEEKAAEKGEEEKWRREVKKKVKKV